MPRNKIIGGISQGAWNDDEEIEQWPETGQLSYNPQGSCGFGKDAACAPGVGMSQSFRREVEAS